MKHKINDIGHFDGSDPADALHDVHARVHQLTGYSAHADQQGLVDWVKGMGVPGEIHLVHGGDGAKRALGKVLGI